MKFYTEDGVWDVVGNNTPIFFIRDPILVRSSLFSVQIILNTPSFGPFVKAGLLLI